MVVNKWRVADNNVVHLPIVHGCKHPSQFTLEGSGGPWSEAWGCGWLPVATWVAVGVPWVGCGSINSAFLGQRTSNSELVRTREFKYI